MNDSDLMRRKVEIVATIGAELSRCNKWIAATMEATTAEELDSIAAHVANGAAMVPAEADPVSGVYTVRQIAELLAVSIETIRRAIRSGDLRAWSPPGEGASPRAQRVSHDDLLAYWRAGGGGEWTIQRVK